ncbi:MAG TPA: nuclear transport factor 2 family protein [Kofleriaceae bacterium]
MTSGTQPSRALLIAAGVMTQAIGALCLVLALASVPIAHDLRSGMSGVVASVVASLAAIVCGTLVWRGRLVPLALAAGLDAGFGIGLPRGGSAIGAILRILPAEDIDTVETVIMVAAIAMFIAAVVCILAVPTALKLRQWARAEIARAAEPSATPAESPAEPVNAIDEAAPTNERPRLSPPGAAVALPSAADTLKGVGTAKLMPTQVIRVDAHPRSKPIVIVAVAVTLIAIGIIVITAATGSSKPDVVASPAATHGSSTTVLGSDTATGSSTTVIPSDAAPVTDAGAIAEPADEFVVRFHAALATAAATDLARLFDAKSFAFGVEAHDLAEGPTAIVAQLREDLGEPPAKGFSVATKLSQVAVDADVGWLAEEIKVGTKSFVMSAVIGLHDGAWTIGALHWAQAMPNDTAYRLAREGELAIPDAIPDAHDDSPLAIAMRTGFASKSSFVEARSIRADSFNFGSAAERLKGGDTIKKIFGRLRATIRLHDSVLVGMIGEHGGWGAANVDFTDTDKDGTEVTQTFRVLAAWIKEEAGWRIVQTQWSNAR